MEAALTKIWGRGIKEDVVAIWVFWVSNTHATIAFRANFVVIRGVSLLIGFACSHRSIRWRLYGKDEGVESRSSYWRFCALLRLDGSRRKCVLIYPGVRTDHRPQLRLFFFLLRHQLSTFASPLSSGWDSSALSLLPECEVGFYEIAARIQPLQLPHE